MFFSLRALKLKTRMVLILGLMALMQTGFIGLFALHYLSHSLDEQIGLRAIHVAKTIAAMPNIVDFVTRRDTDNLASLAVNLAEKTEARFIVIGDHEGVRLAHPTPGKVGKPMHDDDGDFNEPALLHGEAYLQKAMGSLGATMRGKAPIFDADDHHIIGIVSVGYMRGNVQAGIDRYRVTLIVVILLAFTVSVMIALWIANHFKRAIFGLEPEEIAQLFEERNATLETVREGISSINTEGIITTFNRTAIETLDLPSDITLTGHQINDILPQSQLLEVLKTGEPQFDREVWLHDRNLIVNRLPVKRDNEIIGVVASFRLKDELDLVSRKLTQIQKYTETLNSQSHEYSNKLHTIAGLLQIDAKEEALALIGQETQDHQKLINLLVRAVPDPVISGCILGKYNRAREMGLELILDPESDMSEIPEQLPREHLVSILGNLIDNALEATLEHTGAGGNVMISMTDLGNDLIFEVEDEGQGVPEALQEQIFEKGVTTKTSMGHGFGLHLVKQFIDQLDGSITLGTGEQGGARFTVYIPKHLATRNITIKEQNRDG